MDIDALQKAMAEYQTLPLKDMVYQTLCHSIRRGDILAGERLLEMKLAKIFRVSRSPVRAAIDRLEKEHLVERVHHRGVCVAPIADADRKNTLEVQAELEKTAAYLASQRMTNGQLNQLEKAYRQLETSLSKGTITDIIQNDTAFHSCIFEGSGNIRLCQIGIDLQAQFCQCQIEYLRNRKFYSDLIHDYQAIWRAIKEGNGNKASRKVQEHIEKQQLSYLNTKLDKLNAI